MYCKIDSGGLDSSNNRMKTQELAGAFEKEFNIGYEFLIRAIKYCSNSLSFEIFLFGYCSRISRAN